MTLFVKAFFLISLGLKIFGIILGYRVGIPLHFPPEIATLKVGFGFYQALVGILTWLNVTIPLFPSNIIFWMQNNSVKIFFIKFPWLIIDTIILVLLLSPKIIGRSLLKKLALLNVNLWLFFYLQTQRNSFTEEIYKLFIKPYKSSVLEKRLLLVWLGILFISLLILLCQKIILPQKKKLRACLKAVLRRISPKLLIFSGSWVLVCLITVYLGIWLNFKTPEKVDWKGYWIRPPGDLDTPNLSYIFEKEFILPYLPNKASLYSFCQQNYRLFVNSEVVGEGGIISGREITYYDSWDVKNYLKRGKNSVRVECNNPGLDTQSMVKKQSGMIFQLEAQKGWFKKRIVSDSSWRAAIDERYLQKNDYVSKTSGFQEFFNEGNTIHWSRAEIIERLSSAGWGKLTLRPIPFLESQKISPQKLIATGYFRENPDYSTGDLAVIIDRGVKTKITIGEGNLPLLVSKDRTVVAIDFGKMVVGYPELSAESEEGGKIDIGFAEILGTDGWPDIAKMVSQADSLTFKKGDFHHLWRERRAFRYAVLIFKDFSKPVLLQSFTVKTVNYPADDRESYFNSSDDLLNEIYAVAKYTAKISRQSIFEDCPHRERAQYLGDVRMVSLVNYYNYSDKDLVKKALWDYALSQEEDGFVKAVYPAGVKMIIPDYSAQWISAVWEYYLFSGDTLFLKKIYPNVKKQIEGFDRYTHTDGLVVNQPGWWVFIDHGKDKRIENKSASLNLYYYEALLGASKIAGKLGLSQDNQLFSQKSETLKKTITKSYWLNDIGLYDDCVIGGVPCNHPSRQTNYLALLFGFDFGGKEKLSVNKLLFDQNMQTIITPYFNTFAVDSLFTNGYPNEAVNLLRDYWGAMIKKGATTFWETYDPKTGKETSAFGESLSHGWSSGPAYLLPKWVLGIKPTSANFSTFEVKPVLTDLKFAFGRIPANNGKIEVYWKAGDELELSLNYDFSARAEIILPGVSGSRLSVNGKLVEALVSDGNIKYWVDSPGSYKFVLKLSPWKSE